MTANSLPPIFVVGTGRSGSTAFFGIFAKHSNVAWLSSRAWDRSQSPALNKFVMHLRGFRLIDELLIAPPETIGGLPILGSPLPGILEPLPRPHFRRRDTDCVDPTP